MLVDSITIAILKNPRNAERYLKHALFLYRQKYLLLFKDALQKLQKAEYMKYCPTCNETKDIGEFYRVEDGDDRFQVSCLSCRAAGLDGYLTESDNEE